MKSTRSYTMDSRARSVEETRRRILQATFELHTEQHTATIALDRVAERAGVSVQTILRHFGTRDGLLRATAEHGRRQVAEERRAPVGDLPVAVRVLLDHYELRGAATLMLLAQEGEDEVIRSITDDGRRLHRTWVEEVFAPFLDPLPPDDRETLLDLLVVATDVSTWKLLRLDRGLSRDRTEQRLHHLLGALLGPVDHHDPDGAR